MAVPAARTLIKLEDASGTDLTIKVTGYQWKWQYEYLNENVSFFSSLDRVSDEARQRDSGAEARGRAELPARTSTTRWSCRWAPRCACCSPSKDVIHAWWVPELAVKKDAIPGVVNETLVRDHARTRPASTAASAPSCAAATTASCRSSSRRSRPRTTRPGSRRSAPPARRRGACDRTLRRSLPLQRADRHSTFTNSNRDN